VSVLLVPFALVFALARGRARAARWARERAATNR